MDQSDNVDSTYLLINNKTLAQNTPANAKAYADAEGTYHFSIHKSRK